MNNKTCLCNVVLCVDPVTHTLYRMCVYILPRLVAMKTILLWKVITISAAYAVCMLLLDCRENDKGWGQVCLVPHLLWAIPITAAAAHLAFSAAKMSLEKDWVVTIASGDTVWLSAINSKMTQIDLTWWGRYDCYIRNASFVVCTSSCMCPVLTFLLCITCVQPIRGPCADGSAVLCVPILLSGVPVAVYQHGGIFLFVCAAEEAL